MKCEAAHNQISDYVEGRIEPPMRVVLESHLADCAACREELEGARELASLFRGLPVVEPPASFRAQVLARVSEQRPARRWMNRLALPVRRHPWAASAVGTAAAVALLFTRSTQINSLTNGPDWNPPRISAPDPLRASAAAPPDLIFSGTGSSLNPLQGPVKINLLFQPKAPVGRMKVLLEDMSPGLTCETQGVSTERGKVLWQGSASPDQPLTLPLVFKASQPAVHRALLLIEGDEQTYRRMILLPALAQTETAPTGELRGEWSSSDVLTQLARQFGVVIATDLTRQRPVYTRIKLTLPGRAVSQLAAHRNLQWKVSNGVYNVYAAKTPSP